MAKINFKQPKYVVPLLALPFIFLFGYAAQDLFAEKELKGSRELKNTKTINIELPEANVKEDTKTKLEALKEVFKKSSDFAAIQNIEKEDESIEGVQENSLYTEEEMRRIDSLNFVSQLGKKEIENEIGKITSDYQGEKNVEERENSDNSVDKEMQLFKEQMRYVDSLQNPERYEIAEERKIKENLAKINISRASTTAKVTKIQKTNIHFNTLQEKVPRDVITAMIDENITVLQGSRVRIKLLDDIMIEQIKFKKGNYLYGIVSEFAAERVKISINSVMVDAQHYELELDIYDIDGIEGIYCPKNSFREFSKDLGTKSTRQQFQTDDESNIAPEKKFAVDLMKNVYQGAAQALGRNISKKKALLKYNTRLYLINKKGK